MNQTSPNPTPNHPPNSDLQLPKFDQNFFVGIFELLQDIFKGAFSDKAARIRTLKRQDSLLMLVAFSLSYSVFSLISMYFNPWMRMFIDFGILYITVTLISAIAGFFIVSWLLFKWIESAKKNEGLTLLNTRKALAYSALLMSAGAIVGILLGMFGISSLGGIVSFAVSIFACMYLCKTIAETVSVGAWGIFFRLLAIAIFYGIVSSLILSPLTGGFNSGGIASLSSGSNSSLTAYEDLFKTDGTIDETALSDHFVNKVLDSAGADLSEADRAELEAVMGGFMGDVAREVNNTDFEQLNSEMSQDFDPDATFTQADFDKYDCENYNNPSIVLGERDVVCMQYLQNQFSNAFVEMIVAEKQSAVAEAADEMERVYINAKYDILIEQQRGNIDDDEAMKQQEMLKAQYEAARAKQAQ